MKIYCAVAIVDVGLCVCLFSFQRNIINNLANWKCSRCHSWTTSCHWGLSFFSPLSLSPLMVCHAPYGHRRSRRSPLHCKNQSRGMNRCSSWPCVRVRVCVRRCVRCLTLDFSHSSDTAHLLAWSDPIWSASWPWGQCHPLSLLYKKKRKKRKRKKMLTCKEEGSHLHLISHLRNSYTTTNHHPGYLYT